MDKISNKISNPEEVFQLPQNLGKECKNPEVRAQVTKKALDVFQKINFSNKGG